MKNIFKDWLTEKIPFVNKKTESKPLPSVNKPENPSRNQSRNPNPNFNSKNRSRNFDRRERFNNQKPTQLPTNQQNNQKQNKQNEFKKHHSNPNRQEKNINFSPIDTKISTNPRHLIGFDQSRPFYHGPKKGEEPKLRLIPIGGVDEVGQNCMIVEYGDDMIIIDMGIAFPGRRAYGIKYYIPDLEYVYKNIHRLKGIVITHGHLDHIGAIPYLIEKLHFAPIYATKLTVGLIKHRLEEFKLEKVSKIVTYDPKETLIFGGIKVGFYRVAHSIPDAVGVYIKTETGSAVHSGDFKFCDEPSDGIPQDLEKMRMLGSKNIDLLMSDSTNALNEGRTIPDKVIAENLDKIIATAKNRVIIATFSSQLGRMQEILNSAQKHGRYVFISGRSIETNLKIAKELGYIKYPENLIKDSAQAKDIPLAKSLILCTGSQGESEASILKMIYEKHKFFKIIPSDTVIFSSSPIPGNEVDVYEMLNNICRLKATIIHNKVAPVHTSGHAYIEECKELMRLIKPKFFSPIHGTYFLRAAHKEIALKEGFSNENVFLVDNGDIIEIHKGTVKVLKERIIARHVIVDGESVGMDGTNVIRDREIMSEGGVLILNFIVNRNKTLIKLDNIISQGFLYESEFAKLEPHIKESAIKTYENIISKNPELNFNEIKSHLNKILSNYCDKKLNRVPVIIPTINIKG